MSTVPPPWVEHLYADLKFHVRVRAYGTYRMEYEVREIVLVEGDNGPVPEFACTTNTGGQGRPPTSKPRTCSPTGRSSSTGVLTTGSGTPMATTTGASVST